MSLPRYPLILDDGNCHLSSHPQELDDCTVRALAIVTGLLYDHIYDVLKEAGRKPNRGFHSDRWIKKRGGRVFGGRFKVVPIGKHNIPLAFGQIHYQGRYLLETNDHTWALVNGEHRDLLRVKDSAKLTGAWQWHPKL